MHWKFLYFDAVGLEIHFRRHENEHFLAYLTLEREQNIDQGNILVTT